MKTYYEDCIKKMDDNGFAGMDKDFFVRGLDFINK